MFVSVRICAYIDYTAILLWPRAMVLWIGGLILWTSNANTLRTLRKYATLLGESAKRQAQSCCHSDTGGCRRCADKAPARTRRRKKNAAQWRWVREWLFVCLCVCVCVCVLIWLAWPGLRGRCLAKCALNCKCRHKQGTSKYKPGYVQIQTGYVQISTGIHSDTE